MVGIIAMLALLMGYVASSRDSAATRPQNHLLVLLASLVVGTTYVTFTLPKAMMSIGADRGWSALANFGHGGLEFNQHLAELAALPALMRGLFWAILLYGASLFVLAIRHGRMELFTWGPLHWSSPPPSSTSLRGPRTPPYGSSYSSSRFLRPLVASCA